MKNDRAMPTTKALRDQHSIFAEQLGGLAACLATLDSGHPPNRSKALAGIQGFVAFMNERLAEHCADEHVLGTLFPDPVGPGIEPVRRTLAMDRGALPPNLSNLADAARAAIAGDRDADRNVVLFGYAFGQALHCHCCREERGLLDVVDRELGTAASSGEPASLSCRPGAC